MCGTSRFFAFGLLVFCIVVGMLIVLVRTYPFFSREGKDRGGEDFVYFHKRHVDFGTVSSGGTLQTEFIFINKSGEPIRIDSVGTSCYCLTSDHTKEEVLPEKEGIVILTLKTDYPHDLSKSDNPVDIFHSAFVHFAGQDSPFVLGVATKILPDFIFSPRRLQFSLVDSNTLNLPLRIERRGLGEDAFLKLSIYSAKYRIEEIMRNTAMIELIILPQSHSTDRLDSPIRIEYADNYNQAREVKIPCQWENHAQGVSPSLLPARYYKKFDKNVSAENIVEQSKEIFLLKNASDGYSIQKIYCDSDNLLVCWNVIELNKIEIWFQNIPDTQVFNKNFVVRCIAKKDGRAYDIPFSVSAFFDISTN